MTLGRHELRARLPAQDCLLRAGLPTGGRWGRDCLACNPERDSCSESPGPPLGGWHEKWAHPAGGTTDRGKKRTARPTRGTGGLPTQGK